MNCFKPPLMYGLSKDSPVLCTSVHRTASTEQLSNRTVVHCIVSKNSCFAWTLHQRRASGIASLLVFLPEVWPTECNTAERTLQSKFFRWTQMNYNMTLQHGRGREFSLAFLAIVGMSRMHPFVAPSSPDTLKRSPTVSTVERLRSDESS